RAKHGSSVVRTQKPLASTLRMRHHSKHVAVLITNSGDIRTGAVGVGFIRGFPVPIAVPEHDLSVLFQRAIGRIVASIVTFSMGDWYRKHAAVFVFAGKRSVFVFDSNIHVSAYEMKSGISHQRPRQQARLA